MKENVWIFNHYATNMLEKKGGRHYWFAEELIDHGYGVTIFCASTRHINKENIDTGSKKYKVNSLNKIPFVYVKTTDYKENGWYRFKNMYNFYKNLFPVSKEFVKSFGKPEVIIASSVHPLTMVAGIKVAKKLGIPCICEIRDLWPEAIFKFNKAKEKSWLGRLLISGEKWIYENADALIFTKEGDTDYIKEKSWDIYQGGKIDLNKAYYINNGVDIANFDNSIKENIIKDEDLHSSKFTVVYAGAIRPVNNVENIINAAILLEKYEDIQILIYGDGNEKEIMEKKIKSAALTNVKLKGFVSKEFIPYILSKSSVNILNYSQNQYNWKRGNSSNKLFEYMAARKPIISTVKMGYSILEKYKCGIEIEDSTPKELAEAIIRIKNMDEEEYKKMGRNGRRGVKDFDFKVLSKKLIDVIEETKDNYAKNHIK